MERTLTIKKRAFCSNWTEAQKITVTPEDLVRVTGDGVSKQGANWVFIPSQSGAFTDNKRTINIVAAWSDETKTIQVTVHMAPSPAFSFEDVTPQGDARASDAS